MVLAVVIAALLGSIVASVTGFGVAALLLPILIWAFGVREAVPMLAVVQLFANGSRVGFNRREVVLPVVGWFALGAIPLTIAGAAFFAMAPIPLLRPMLGGLLLFMVVYRHTRSGQTARLPLRAFAMVGAVFGFLNGLLGTLGPLLTPFFLAHGLTKGAFIGTEALATVVMQATKVATYQRFALLSPWSAALGLAVGGVMIVGSFIGKRLLDRLPERYFRAAVELLLVVSGVQLLFGQ